MGVTGETGASVMNGFGSGSSSARDATVKFTGLQHQKVKVRKPEMAR